MSERIALNKPVGLTYANSGSTGLWLGDQVVDPYSKAKILGILNAEMPKPEFKHKPGLWECTDRAYWGVSAVRCQCPGAPVAVAIGVAKERAVAGQDHAVIYFWYLDNNNWKPILFDPLYGEIQDFETKVLIPFPIYRPGGGYGLRKDLPPFEGIGPINGGYISPSYDDYFVDNFGKITDIISNKTYISCNMPTNQKEQDVFIQYRTREDRAFWAFTHIRSKFNANAVGFALGTGNVKGKIQDHAALVLWRDADTYEFWDVEKGIRSTNFNARFVLL